MCGPPSLRPPASPQTRTAGLAHGVLAKALSPSPAKRQQEVSEFAYELKVPAGASWLAKPPPLIERDPVLFWKCLCLLLALTTTALGLLVSQRV